MVLGASRPSNIVAKWCETFQKVQDSALGVSYGLRAATNKNGAICAPGYDALRTTWEERAHT
eukprot:5808491-Pleurochrysis_carterae.AAC.1